MPAASAIRLQIESALAARIPAALSPVPRVVRPVASTGIEALDEVLRGGLPVGALTELVGPECSGRTMVALKFVAGLTQAGRVCAWIDVSNALDPASAAAAGVDLERLLWVRCGAAKPAAPHATQRFSLPEKYLTPAPVMKGLHGGGCGGHPRGEVKGLAAAVSGLLRPETPNLAPRCAEPQ
ncbi:MAG: ATPase domain-containing protein, partial [Terracidiphilus sp.]